MGFLTSLFHKHGSEAWVSRGNTLRSYRRYREALRCYDRAIDIEPSCVDAWIEKGRLLHQMGNSELALRRFNRALEIDPARAEAKIREGFLQNPARPIKADVCSLKIRELGLRAC